MHDIALIFIVSSVINTFICVKVMRYKDYIIESFPTIITMIGILIIQTIMIYFELYWFSVALSTIAIGIDWICIIFNRSNK